MAETSEERRLRQFGAAVEALGRAMALSEQRPLTEIERAGAVQFFELSWELGWKALRDEVIAGGLSLDYIAPSTVIRAAFAAGVIPDGDAWVAAGRARNLLTHSYDPDYVDEALAAVQAKHLPLLRAYLDHRRSL